MCQLASISSRMRRFVALSSTTSTRRPSSAVRPVRPAASPRPCGRSKTAVKWNVLPRPDLALDPQPAAHQLDQAARDGQTQARAAEAARRRAVGLRERLEDVAPACRRGMPMPVSLTTEVQRHGLGGRLLGTCRRASTTSPCGRELDGVADDVEQHLPQPAGVADQRFRHVGRRCRRPARCPSRRRAAPGASPHRRPSRAGRTPRRSRSSRRASIFEKSSMSLMIVEQRFGRRLHGRQVVVLLGREPGLERERRSCRGWR